MDTEWNQDDWDGCDWADYLMPNDYEQDGHQSRGDFGLLFFVGEYKIARLGSQCIRAGALTKHLFLFDYRQPKKKPIAKKKG